MSTPIDPHTFIAAMLPVVRQCAETSLIFFGKTANIGKAADASLVSIEAQTASSALTALDTSIQDIILSVASQLVPDVRCIAEENTPFRRKFSGREAGTALILDPIDGTLHFQRGDHPYHISLGLAREGRMQAAIVARPSEDKLFTAVCGDGAYVQRGNRRPRRLRLPQRPRTNKAFISSKARPFQACARPQLDPQEFPIGAALVLTLIAEGELCAYLTRQVELYDVGPPSLIAEEAGARCFLRNGQSPSYRRNRKFSYFLCAASEQTEATLMEVVRQGEKVMKSAKSTEEDR